MSKFPRTIIQSLLVASSLAGFSSIPGCGHNAGSSLPNTAAQIGTRRGWNVFLAEPCSDTLPAPWREVIPAVKPTFQSEDWRVQRSNLEKGDFVTSWKPIRHILVRLFAGRIEARCAVSIRPIDPSRTLVVFQGGIASRRDIAHSPALRSAKNAYRKACRDWQGKLRAEVMRRQGSARS